MFLIIITEKRNEALNGKIDVNKPCVFPWKYSSDGPSFNGCANPYENEGGNWCATGLNRMKYICFWK